MVISLTNLSSSFLSINSARKYLYCRSIFPLFLLVFRYFYSLYSLYRFLNRILPMYTCFSEKSFSSLHFPGQVQQVVGETRKKQMDFVGHKPYIPGPCPLKMQRKDPKHPFHLGSYTRKDPVPPLLPPREGPTSTSFGQNATKFALFTTLAPNIPAIISLVREDGLFVSSKELVKDLGVMDIGRRTDELRHKVAFGINSYMIFVAIDCLFALLSEGGIVVFSRLSGGFDPSTGSIGRGAGINNLSSFQFKTLLSELTFKLREATAIKVHGFEIRAEARDGRIIGDRIYG